MAPGKVEFNGDSETLTKLEQSKTPQSSIDERLQSLIAEYIKSNPNSQQAFRRAQHTLPGGNTRSVLYSDPFPLVIKSGRDCYITSIDNREYVDFLSDFSAGMYGHSHPVIKEAIAEALETGFSLGGLTEKEAQLGELIKSRFTSIELIRFCNSGTEANTMALASAVAFTGRKKILVFDGGYHGGTLSFHSRTNPINLPHDFVYSTYNDITATRPLITNDLAAILVEPMQGAGGMIPGTYEFLSFLRTATSSVGALLIFDEVVTSRLHYHGLQGFHGIAPDLTTLGKYLGGGFSFGAFGGRGDVLGLFDAVSGAGLGHSGTFNNNIFSMTAAVRAFGLVNEESIGRMNALGDLLRERGNEVAREAGLPMRLTGVGSMVGFQFSGERSAVLKDALYFFLLGKGMMIGKRGFVSLNLVHERGHIDNVLDGIREFVKVVYQGK